MANDNSQWYTSMGLKLPYHNISPTTTTTNNHYSANYKDYAVSSSSAAAAANFQDLDVIYSALVSSTTCTNRLLPQTNRPHNHFYTPPSLDTISKHRAQLDINQQPDGSRHSTYVCRFTSCSDSIASGFITSAAVGYWRTCSADY